MDASSVSVTLDFCHPSRMSPDVCQALGLAFPCMCACILHSVVELLPLYFYEALVLERLQDPK